MKFLESLCYISNCDDVDLLMQEEFRHYFENINISALYGTSAISGKKEKGVGWSSCAPRWREFASNALGVWCFWILVELDCGHLVHPDTSSMATGRPLPSDRGFPRLIIPQRSVHTTSVPTPHTTQFILYISPTISIFWRWHYEQDCDRSYLIQYWLSQQLLRPTSHPRFLLAKILKYFHTASPLYLLGILLAARLPYEQRLFYTS